MNGGGVKERVSYLFHAYHLTETLSLKALDKFLAPTAISQSAERLVYQEGPDSYVFIYRFGSVIFFNVESGRRQEVVEKIKKVMGYGPGLLISEDFGIQVREGRPCWVGFEHATLDGLALDRLEIMALVLAQSTALEHFEVKVEQMLRESGDIGRDLRQRGRLARTGRSLKRFIGKCITTKQNLVASLYLLDKPEQTWEDRVLDHLYRGAVEMFEIRDRHKTVDYKLRMIQENLELISDLLQNRHANYLEWTIIILIAIEVVLFVFQLFVMEG